MLDCEAQNIDGDRLDLRFLRESGIQDRAEVSLDNGRAHTTPRKVMLRARWIEIDLPRVSESICVTNELLHIDIGSLRFAFRILCGSNEFQLGDYGRELRTNPFLSQSASQPQKSRTPA